ncbi:hypothetical protein D3C87_1489400 [compost metagenome]
MLHRFAHGLTPEQHGFDGDEFGGCVEIGFQPAGQRRAVEKNGFLRQPVQPGARPCGNAGGDGGGSGGCLVDLLAGLRRHHQRGAGSGNSLPFHFISAGQSAGGVDEDGLDLVGKRIRQADLGATFLEQLVQPAAPFDSLGYNASSATGALLPGRFAVFETGRADGLLFWLHAVSETVAEADPALAPQSFLTTASTTICPSVLRKKSHILSAASTVRVTSPVGILRSTAGSAFGVCSPPGLRVRTADAASTSAFMVARGQAWSQLSMT